MNVQALRKKHIVSKQNEEKYLGLIRWQKNPIFMRYMQEAVQECHK